MPTAISCTRWPIPVAARLSTPTPALITRTPAPTRYLTQVCLDLVTQGAGLTAATYDAPTIARRIVDPAFPIGHAVNMTLCEGIFCNLECGLP